MKVFLGGEGTDDLGDWGGHPSYREGEPGVIEALLRRESEQNVENSGCRAVEADPQVQGRSAPPPGALGTGVHGARKTVDREEEDAEQLKLDEGIASVQAPLVPTPPREKRAVGGRVGPP